MRRALLFLVVFMLLAGPALADEKILGRWDSQTRSRGAIGSMLYFQADGTVAITVGAMLDFNYHTDGNRLYIAPDEEKSAGSMEFSVVGDKLIRKDIKSGKPREEIRIGHAVPGAAPIVGRWRSPHETGANTVEEFTADGQLRLRIPFRTDKGEYKADGSTLSIRIPGRPRTYLGTYRIEGGILILTGRQNGTQERYKRIDGAPIIVTGKDLARMRERLRETNPGAPVR